MILPYLQNLPSDMPAVTCWLVDGKYVRDKLNIEFTNFGQYLQIPQIPKWEMWVDNVNGTIPEEAWFYIQNMVAQRLAIKQGMSIEKARQYGDTIERRERGKLLPRLPAMAPEELFQLCRQHSMGEDEYGIQIYWMDGQKVRTYSGYIDWVEGGHDLIYPFVWPKRSIWLDDQTTRDEVPFIRFHESFERNKMEAEKLSYQVAHRRASAAELEMRVRFDQWAL